MSDDVVPRRRLGQGIFARAPRSRIFAGRKDLQLMQNLRGRRNREASPKTLEMTHGRCFVCCTSEVHAVHAAVPTMPATRARGLLLRTVGDHRFRGDEE